MRIVFLHAAKNYGYSLLDMDHYSQLVESELNLVTEERWERLDDSSRSKLDKIESLPTSCIVGLMLVSKMFWFDAEKSYMRENKWCTGPVCYQIDEVLEFEEPIENVSGKVGFWELSHCLKKLLVNDKKYKYIGKKIKEWKRKHGNNLHKSRNYNEIGCLTIQQPFVHAILSKKKRIENRSSNIGNVSKKAVKKPKPNQIHCRFCWILKRNIANGILTNELESNIDISSNCKCPSNFANNNSNNNNNNKNSNEMNENCRITRARAKKMEKQSKYKESIEMSNIDFEEEPIIPLSEMIGVNNNYNEICSFGHSFKEKSEAVKGEIEKKFDEVKKQVSKILEENERAVLNDLAKTHAEYEAKLNGQENDFESEIMSMNNNNNSGSIAKWENEMESQLAAISQYTNRLLPVCLCLSPCSAFVCLFVCVIIACV